MSSCGSFGMPACMAAWRSASGPSTSPGRVSVRPVRPVVQGPPRTGAHVLRRAIWFKTSLPVALSAPRSGRCDSQWAASRLAFTFGPIRPRVLRTGASWHSGASRCPRATPAGPPVGGRRGDSSEHKTNAATVNQVSSAPAAFQVATPGNGLPSCVAPGVGCRFAGLGRWSIAPGSPVRGRSQRAGVTTSLKETKVRP